MTIGIGLISTWTESPTSGELIGYMFMLGLGVGSIIQSILLYCQSIVEAEDLASVTALLIFFRTSK